MLNSFNLQDTPSVDFSFNPWSEKNFTFYDKTLLDDTNRGVKEVQEFWRLLALCHTVSLYFVTF